MLTYNWTANSAAHEVQFLPVRGTAGKPFLFGRAPVTRAIEIRDFYMMATPVTQELWTHVMGANPSARVASRFPVENVSWNQITAAGGFLDRINSGPILAALAGNEERLRFRLPSEAEWEYAARGGPHWPDGFAFSGSNNIDVVAWYGPRFSAWRRLLCGLLGWPRGWRIAGRFPHLHRPTGTHPVATKASNQLGLYVMCGNVWEWCQDVCTDDLHTIPPDGTPYTGSGDERRLRGGSHQNWDIHCTVWFRYGIDPQHKDGCIGFRLALGV